MMATFLLQVAASLALALSPVDPSSAPVSLVDLTIVGDRTDAEAMIAAVTAFVATDGIVPRIAREAELDLDAVTSPATSPAGNLLGRAWIDLRSPRRVLILLADVPGERFARRTLPVADLDESGRETIAQVLMSTLTAFKEDSFPSLTAPELLASAMPAERTSGVAHHRAHWQAAIAYEAQRVAAAIERLDGLAASVTWAGTDAHERLRPLLWFRARTTWPSNFHDPRDAYNGDVRLHAAGVGLGAEVGRREGLRGSVLGGVMLQLTQVSAVPIAPRSQTFKSAGDRVAIRMPVYLSLQLSYPITKRIDVQLRAAIDVVSRLRLTVGQPDGAGARTLLRGSPHEAQASIGFAINF